jgi:hypothetical protein
MTREKLNWWERLKFWRAAYYLLFDVGAKALPSGEPLATGCKGGGKDFEEFAIDLRAAAGDDAIVLDRYYECMSEDPGKEFRSVTDKHTKSVLRKTWQKIECTPSLVNQGRKIATVVWGDNSESYID